MSGHGEISRAKCDLHHRCPTTIGASGRQRPRAVWTCGAAAPASDVDVVLIYAAFSPIRLMPLEGLGFFGPTKRRT
jgi:hypothetical protein